MANPSYMCERQKEEALLDLGSALWGKLAPDGLEFLQRERRKKWAANRLVHRWSFS
jgi:hypothetical protein